MKTNNLRLSTTLITMIIVLNSCIKSVDPPAPTPARTYVSIMHLAPTAPSLDVFFNDKKVSNEPFNPGNITSIYNAVEKGMFSIRFKKADADSVVAEVPLAQYDSLNFYTIFVHNQQAGGPAYAVRIQDDFSQLTESNPFYRFFHAGPTTGAVDLYINNVKVATGRQLADNVAVETLNKFSTTNSGFNTVEVKLTGTETVVASLNADLINGNAYTFYLRGLDGGTGNNQLSLGILRAVN